MHNIQLPCEPNSGLNYLRHFLPLLLPSHYVFVLSSLINPKPYPKLHPHAIGMGLSSSLPLLLASWQSLSWILKRDTLFEMASCVVTGTSWSRRSFSTSFFTVDPPSLPPITIAASWSMNLLPSTPRHPKLATAKAISLWVRSSNDTCPRRA